MADSYRILVTGSRTWDSVPLVRGLLRQAVADRPPGTEPVIVHGACRSGADAIAAKVAATHGWQTEPHPADWQAHGKAAGFRRNAEMVDAGADICLAFITACTAARCAGKPAHGSHGTSHCAGLAERAGIPVRKHYPR